MGGSAGSGKKRTPEVGALCRSPTALAPVRRGSGMNPTAIMHIAAAVLVGAGLFVSGQTLRIGLIGLGVVLFVAGIVVARRGD